MLAKCNCYGHLSQMINQNEEFSVHMMERISEDEAFLERVCFSDKATFHVSGKLNETQCDNLGIKTLSREKRDLQK